MVCPSAQPVADSVAAEVAHGEATASSWRHRPSSDCCRELGAEGRQDPSRILVGPGQPDVLHVHDLPTGVVGMGASEPERLVDTLP